MLGLSRFLWGLPIWMALNGSKKRPGSHGSHPNLQVRPVARVLEDHEPKGHWDPIFPSNWRSWTCQDEMVNLVKPRKVDFWIFLGWQLTGNIRKPWLITIKSWVVPGNVHFLGMVGRVTLMNRVSVFLLWRVSIKHVWACLQCVHFMLTCCSKPCTKKMLVSLVSILRQGVLLFWSALKCLGAPWILSIVLPWVAIACQGFWWRVFEVSLTLLAV